MNQNRERRLLQELDRLAFIASGVAIVIFVAIYFIIASGMITGVPPIIRDFVLGVTLNIIPIFLVFVVSYALFRRIQDIKSEHETEEMVTKIADEIQTHSDRKISTGSESEPTQLKTRDLLVRNADTNIIYLIDRYGLPHPIRDENTILYLMDMLDHQPESIAQVPSDKLKPEGAEITSIRDWRRPRTKEDEMSFEAQNHVKVLDKDIQMENGARILYFGFRYDGDSDFQISSAELVFDSDAPVTITDISAKNKPNHRGLLSCKLLFDGELESKKLSSQTDFRLDLILRENLSPERCKTITKLRLGYIKVKGLYQGTDAE